MSCETSSKTTWPCAINYRVASTAYQPHHLPVPHPATYLHLPEPCPESWAAMTPTGAGRHCAACQQVVVDFSQQTDAEILAYFRRAGGGSTCGHFRPDQLGRPLQPAPAGRTGPPWRAWLAMALAAWGTHPAVAAGGAAPAPTHHTPARPRARVPHRPRGLARYVQGTVRDAATQQVLVGVAVFLRGENRVATTDANGCFRLPLSPRRPRGGRALVLHFAGYQSATVRLPATTRPTTRLALELRGDDAADGVVVIGQEPPRYRNDGPSGSVQTLVADDLPIDKPAPEHLRSFWYWLKTRVFRCKTDA